MARSSSVGAPRGNADPFKPGRPGHLPGAVAVRFRVVGVMVILRR
jgi:hypothetical protein